MSEPFYRLQLFILELMYSPGCVHAVIYGLQVSWLVPIFRVYLWVAGLASHVKLWFTESNRRTSFQYTGRDINVSGLANYEVQPEVN